MSTRDEPRLIRSSMVVAVGTGLSRITGMARVIVLAAALGSDLFSDAYNLANTTPNIIYELLIGGVISATLVPLFVRADETGDEDGPSAVFSVGVLATTALALVAVLAAPLVARAYVGGGNPQADRKLDLLVPMLQLLLPQILFYGVTALTTAALNARRHFVAAAYSPVLNNLVVIGVAGYLLARYDRSGGDGLVSEIGRDPTGRLVLGLGSTAGIAAMAIPLVWAMRGADVRLRWLPDWRHPALRQLLRLSGWTLGYVAANQIALLVVLRLADGPPPGTVTAYQNAFIYFQLPHGLIAVTLMTTFLPELARAAVSNDLAAFRARFARALHLLLALIVPASVGYVLLGSDLTVVMLRHGSYSAADASLTGRTLVAFAVGLVGYSAYLLTLRAFYALSDTRTPFLVNVAENGANVVFALLAVQLVTQRAVGLAAAYAAAYLLAAGLALWILHRRIGADAGQVRTSGLQAMRILGASAAMAAAVLVALALSPSTAWVRIVVAAPVGIVAYGAAAVALGVDGSRAALDAAVARITRA